MNEPRSTVDLHIERLVLDGFAGVDRAGLGAAVEAELARLLTERGVPPGLASGGATPRLAGGRFTAAPDAPTDAVASQVARSIYGGLQR